MAELNDKQRRFVDEYIKDLNGKQSAIRAGYSERTAESQASRLLSNAKVKAYMQKRMAEHEKNTIADQQEILEFLTAMMRGEVDEPIPLLDVGGTQRIVDVRPSAQARKSAAELLGKRYAMWVDKKEVEGDLSVNIQIDYGEDEE